MRRRREKRSESGVEIVEFAIIAVLLFLLIFGLIDFGWAFSQNLDVKHSAREGARLAAVNADTTCATLISDIKGQASDLKASKMTVSLTDITQGQPVPLPLPLGLGNVTPVIGDTVAVGVQYPLSSLSGLTSALNGGNLTSTVQIRMEQNASWTLPCSG
jgi:Flp pilus assembly protein TadG